MSTDLLEIIAAVRALPPEKRAELAQALQTERLIPVESDRLALIDSIRGKYAWVNTTVDDFLRRKHEDRAAEDPES